MLSDLYHDTHLVPFFAEGVHHHRLLGRIAQASAEGRTLDVNPAAQLNN
jgi:hypothetical protein